MRPSLVLLIFAIVGSCIFVPSLNHPLVFDDEDQILNNPVVHNFHLAELFGSSSFSAQGGAKMQGNYYKPLMTTFYAVIYQMYGPEPAAFRLPLLTAHIFSAFLLFLIFAPLLGSRAAFVLGSVFLVHPVNAEVVLYVADAQDIFFMFFGLLSLYFLSRWSGIRLWIGLALSLTMSLLSKETGGLFLPIAVAFAYFFRRKNLRVATVVCVTVGLFYAGLRFSLGLTRLESPQLALHRASWWERMSTVPSALWHYIEIYIFPWRLSLTTDYVVRVLTVKEFWLPLAGVSLFTLTIWQIGRRLRGSDNEPAFRFFTFMAFLWFLMHGQVLVALDGVYADRWFYLGTIAFTGIFLLPLKDRGFFHGKTAAALFVALCGLWSARSFWRTLDWAQALTLYESEIKVHPDDALMNNNVGVELCRRNKFSACRDYLRKSVEVNPYWSTSLSNLGAAEEYHGNNEEALALYEKSLAIGDYYLAYQNYAKLLFRLGRRDKCYDFLISRGLVRYPNDPVLQQLRKEFP